MLFLYPGEGAETGPVSNPQPRITQLSSHTITSVNANAPRLLNAHFLSQQLTSASRELRFLLEGTSMAGLAVKKSAGFMCNSWISTGLRYISRYHENWRFKYTHMTGQSSTRGLCVKPKQFHTTTSSSTTSSPRLTASETPPISIWLCRVYFPPA
jgi:hypothetical protein